MPQIPEGSVSIRLPMWAGQGARRGVSLVRAAGGLLEGIASERLAALQQSELTSLSAELEGGLTSLYEEIERDPSLNTVEKARARFEEGSEKISQGVLGKASWDPVRQRLTERAFSSRQRFGVAVSRAAFARETDAARASLDSAAETYLKSHSIAGSDVERMDARSRYRIEVRGSPYLTEEEKGDRLRRFDRTASVNRAALLQDENPYELARIAEDEDEFPGLDPYERLKIKYAAEAEIDRRIEKSRQREVSDLDLRISRSPETGESLDDLESEVRAAFERDLISGPGQTQRIQTIDAIRRKLAEDADGAQLIQDVLDGTRYLDPKNTKHQKYLDSFYRAVVAPAMEGMDPNEVVSRLASFSLRMGMIPDTAQGALRGAIRAGDVPARALASRTIALIDESNPLLLDDFADEDISFAKLVASYVEAGIPEAEAVETATKDLQIPEPQKDARRKRYQEEQIGKKNRGWLDGEVGEVDVSLLSDVGPIESVGIWDPNVEIPDPMRGEFDLLVGRFYESGMDEEQARKRALSSLRRTWGVTSIGGRRWQKYAPEVVYANQAGIEWIEEQLRNELIGAVTPPITDEDVVRLEPDLLTGRERFPSYRVMLFKEGDGFVPIPGVSLWRPDWETSPAKERSDTETRAGRERRFAKHRGRLIREARLEAKYGRLPKLKAH